MKVIWKPDGLGRDIAYFGDIRVGQIMRRTDEPRRQNPYEDWQWSFSLPPGNPGWTDASTAETARRAVEAAAFQWLHRADLLDNAEAA